MLRLINGINNVNRQNKQLFSSIQISLILIVPTLQYLRYKNYTDPYEVINAPVNLSEFPSAFFLQTHNYDSILTKNTNLPICMNDEIWNEEMIFDLPEEYLEERIKYQYLYDKYGNRKYSVDENFNKGIMKDYNKTCKWKEISGDCYIFSIQDDYYHKNHVIINFEFKPVLYRQFAADLNRSMEINFYTPSYDFVIDNNIQIGNKYQCIKRNHISGDCNIHEYFVFPDFNEYLQKQEED